MTELIEVLADLSPQKPQVPYYSATLYDPRERPACDAGYWADNLRHTVRFSAAVRAALDDGYRVFAELSPHPLLTHAIEQTAAGIGMPVAALAGMRREQPMPDGLAGLVTDVHAAGAAVDFSVLYPRGLLLDAPLPAWTHRTLVHERDPQAKGGLVWRCTRCWGHMSACPRSPSATPGSADVGTAALPWLGDHQIHNVAVLPGAAYCEMALAAAHTVLGERAEVRDVRFETMLLLDEVDPGLGGGHGRCPRGGRVHGGGRHAEGMGHLRRASAILHTGSDDEEPAGRP